MHSPKILAFVEGVMERSFVNANFGYVEVVTLTNGNGWTVEALCRQIGTKFYSKNMNADQIIVWLDMEEQTIAPSTFQSAIIDALVKNGADPAKIAICLPSRMTENIILADEEAIKNEFEDDSYQYIFEGMNGKVILKKLYAAKGISYRETVHGAAMLKKIRMDRAAQKSPSAASFVTSLNIHCWWLQTS